MYAALAFVCTSTAVGEWVLVSERSRLISNAGFLYCSPVHYDNTLLRVCYMYIVMVMCSR